MKRRSIKLEINLTNKWLYTFIFLGAVLLLAIGVFAYNSGKSASVFGHSAEELSGVCKTDGTGCPPDLGGGIKSCRIVSGRKDGTRNKLVCCSDDEFALSANSPENDFLSFFSDSSGNTVQSGNAQCVYFSYLDDTARALQVTCCK